MSYVHGYTTTESIRLGDQANALTDLLHANTAYRSGARVLEAGCGVGAQTAILVANSPEARFTSIDVSEASLEAARASLIADNVTFQRADVYDLPFADGEFDHVFVCFVLEHLPDPEGALRHLRRVIRPGGTITVIEGDHGSAYFHPDSAAARRAIGRLVQAQAEAGGDALIGRRLYPLLASAGFGDVEVSPRVVYVDGSRPDLAESFTRRTFTAMVEGVAQEGDDGVAGIRDLYRTAEPDGTFCYTFFQAIARA